MAHAGSFKLEAWLFHIINCASDGCFSQNYLHCEKDQRKNYAQLPFRPKVRKVFNRLYSGFLVAFGASVRREVRCIFYFGHLALPFVSAPSAVFTIKETLPQIGACSMHEFIWHFTFFSWMHQK